MDDVGSIFAAMQRHTELAAMSFLDFNLFLRCASQLKDDILQPQPSDRERAIEKPADKWPGIFGQVPLLVEYPYLLPCAVAASITLTGLLCYDGILPQIHQ
ncbi:hypothetical protein EV702DRAFT_1200277 [Suillus placidus]|uniref:Uncharacterized protein n=1 Tax=Suillus placidus TaxID=48579 RepID=A0A9P6ZQ60_9AGAM|nr:hypothetical protein EV702DRAFT_1200277 [Suillus placidus]